MADKEIGKYPGAGYAHKREYVWQIFHWRYHPPNKTLFTIRITHMAAKNKAFIIILYKTAGFDHWNF